MKHPHALVLTQVYSNFVAGHFDQMLELCAPQVTFQLAGKSPLAGKYTRETFAKDYASKLKPLTAGSYHFDIHDILASDLHATVLATIKVTAQGKNHEFRTVHVWRFENGKPLAGYEYARDLYAFDAAFGA